MSLGTGRLVMACVIGIALVLVLGAQALSSVATRSSPDQALAFFPLNGLAGEQLAAKIFQESVAEDEDMLTAGLEGRDIARAGIAKDPLAPKSYAVLAAAQSDEQLAKAILDAASRLNRRDLTLQSMILQERLGSDDYPGMLATLDQILRVHTNYSGRFFVVMTEALKQDEAAPLFPSILDGQSPWHARFLSVAVQDPEARVNLAQIRDQIPIEDAELDRELISGLAEQGEIDAAQRLYARLNRSTVANETGAEQPGRAEDTLWPSQYPPFDWKLADERAFRAQASRDGQVLELFARSGEGGIIAERIMAVPADGFILETALDMRSAVRTDRVRLLLRCGANGSPLLDEALVVGANSFRVESLPEDCRQLTIAINARSMRGEPSLRGELAPITFEPI